MTIAAQYAKALYDLGGNAKRIANLRTVLRRRGHEKLLPKIFAEYQKLELHQRRLQEHKALTPERERTRVLLELYRTLTRHPDASRSEGRGSDQSVGLAK